VATKLTLNLANDGKPTEVLVQEDFETALGKVFPLNQPSSALEARTMSVWTQMDGRRFYLPPNLICGIEENAEED
jgi:hypothetical protein